MDISLCVRCCFLENSGRVIDFFVTENDEGESLLFSNFCSLILGEKPENPGVERSMPLEDSESGQLT